MNKAEGAKIVSLESFKRMKNHPAVVVGVEEITPDIASQWLKANRLNRPIRKKHVAFLSREISSGMWQLNGQPIVICISEDILDGQHRLHAVVDAGKSIRSLVVYGIERDAFKTLDTGAARSAADAIHVWFPDHPTSHHKAVAAAVPHCMALERKVIRLQGKIANQEAIAYVDAHPSMWFCTEELMSFPKDNRPLSLGCGTALYELFQRKDHEAATEFMKQLYTGEDLVRGHPVYVLRTLYLSDQRRTTSSYPASIKLKMAIKAWNLLRRGTDRASHQLIQITPKDADEQTIL